MAVTFHSGQILLTAGDVQRWRDERDELQARLVELNRKLEAAAVFFPEPEPKGATVQPSEQGVLTLSDAIAHILRISQVAMSPKDIRLAISTHGFEPLLGSENYLYTAIKRLADRGLIVRTDHGYVAPSPGSSKEETPDREAGGPLQLTLSGVAGDTAAEAGGT